MIVYQDAKNTGRPPNKCRCGGCPKSWPSSSSGSPSATCYGEIKLTRRFTFLLSMFFKAFLRSNFQTKKLTNNVICVSKSRQLDLSPYLSVNGSEHGAVYDLYAVVNHFGGILYGHYTAFARCPAAESDKNQDDVVGQLRFIFACRKKTGCEICCNNRFAWLDPGWDRKSVV